MDLSKLDRTRLALGVIGLLAFIDSFLEWSHVSVNGHSLSGFSGATKNAWGVSIGGWLPLLLLLALGVIAVLPAFGTTVNLPGGLSLIGALTGALSLVIILIRWVTLPSESDGIYSASWDASYGMYIGLVLAIAAAVFGWMGYTAEGGNFKTIGDSFKQKPAGPPPGQVGPEGQGGQWGPPPGQV